MIPIDCKRCPLSLSRNRIVPPEGPQYSSLIFVGEAPGYEEDKTGRPFIGRSGQLLRRLMEEVGINPKKILITNVCKCRPPDNRTPTPDEIDACSLYLKEELADKRVIVALGRTAVTAVLGQEYFRGNTNWANNVKRIGPDKVVVTSYHPSYIIRYNESRDTLKKSIATAKGLWEKSLSV
jgi:uracil-DNA glycosylase